MSYVFFFQIALSKKVPLRNQPGVGGQRIYGLLHGGGGPTLALILLRNMWMAPYDGCRQQKQPTGMNLW